ncbi:hypothetical protein ElyMa_004525400 [Elysia marginata]|uniref:Uncharacterized protein n=1 Tax=Elysia marginata TaxID=1093978 RepID=A0AAV4HRW5_9GAST|nr:hypothetical protein ElyMa_004525400 [Elysia marginata]
MSMEEFVSNYWKAPECTVHDILQMKPKYIQTMFLGGVQRTPIWLKHRRDLMTKVREEITDTMRWYIKDTADDKTVRDFDMSHNGNKVYLRPFSNDPGQQMFSECLSVSEYVEGDHVRLCGFFPSAFEVDEVCDDDRDEERMSMIS